MADRVTVNGVDIREMAGREGSDDISSGRAELVFLCRGNGDPLICRDALLTVAPETYDGLILAEIARERLSDEDWEFTLNYANVPDVGGYEVTIDTTGGSFTQTEAFAQTKFDAPLQTGVDYGTSIDVQDGRVQGVDRVVASLRLNIVARIAEQFVETPIAYAKIIANATGKKNSVPYLGFAKGELLFLGANGQIISNSDPTLTFQFDASPNISDGTLGTITGINKAGQDFLWVDYLVDKDNATKRDVYKARAAYVAEVYLETDFADLKIGESPP